MATPAYASNGGSGTATSANSVAAPFGSNVTSLNCLVAFIETPTAITVSSVTDTLGQQWTLGSAGNNASGGRTTPAYCLQSVGGANTVTANLSGTAANAVIEIGEYTNVGSVAGNRGADVSAGGSGNSSAPSNTQTPAQSGSLFLVGVGDAVGGITYTAGGSITRRQSVTSPIGLAFGEQVSSSTTLTALASAWSASGTVQWAEAVLVLRPAGTQAVTNAIGTNAGSATSWTTGSFTPKLGAVYLCVVETGGQASQPVGSVTDTASETWTLIQRQNNASGGELSLWLLNGAASASARTLTATGSGGSTSAAIRVFELTGVIPNASLVDQIAPTTGNGTAVSVTTSATSIANETAVLVVGTAGAFGTSTPGGSDSLVQNNTNALGSYLVSTRILNATGTVTMTATLGTSSQWSAILITLKTGGVSYVQGNVIAASATTVVTPMTFNVAPGNTLVAGANSINQTTLADSLNTYTKRQDSGANAARTAVWEAHGVVGGKTTLTLTNSPASRGNLFVLEFSGLAASPYDVGATTYAASPASATTATPNGLFEIAVAVAGFGATGPTETLTSGWVTPLANPGQNATVVGMMAQFTVGGVPPAFTVTDTDGSGNTVAVALATFKIAASPTYYNHQVTETLSLAETWTRHSTFNRTGTETLAAAETWTRHSTFNRTGTETLTASESWTRPSTFGRKGTETLSLAEAWSRHTTFNRTVAETLTAAETWTRHSTFGRKGTETLTFAETWSMGGVFTRTPSVTVRLTRTVDTTASLGRTVTVYARLDND